MITSYCFNSIADCGVPPPPVDGSVQPYTNTTEGSVVVFQCDPGFVPEGEMTTVCGRDGQWTPNPGGITCSPRPTPTFRETLTEASILTPSSTPDPTGPGESQLLLLCISSSVNIYKLLFQYYSSTSTTCHHFLADSSNEGSNICTSCSTSVVITAVVSCAVSFITGALVGAVVYYCTVRKKSNCQKCYSLAIVHKQQQQQPAPVYEDVMGQSQNIELKENVAYDPVQQ